MEIPIYYGFMQVATSNYTPIPFGSEVWSLQTLLPMNHVVYWSIWLADQIRKICASLCWCTVYGVQHVQGLGGVAARLFFVSVEHALMLQNDGFALISHLLPWGLLSCLAKEAQCFCPINTPCFIREKHSNCTPQAPCKSHALIRHYSILEMTMKCLVF